MKRPVILSLGEILWDLFPDGARFGGAPANFACHAAALGAEVTMVSAVGKDARGSEAIEILKRYGIHTELVQSVADAPTGTVGIELDSDGKPSFTIHENSAWDQMAWTPELETRVTGADAIYFGTLGQRAPAARATIERALSLAAEHGIPRILDVNLRAPFHDEALLRESVRRASILKLSDDELRDVCAACGHAPAGPATESLRALRKSCALDLVVMTRGAEGGLLVAAGERIEQPGIPTTVVDTVGAGDAFTAAFMVGLLRGDAHRDILHHACQSAAAVCGHPGAVPLPP